MSSNESSIENFLRSKTFAVAGASNDRAKFGNRVLLTLSAFGKAVTPLNPKENEIEGMQAYASVLNMPSPPEALSIVTPPAITAHVVAQAIQAGVQRIWMQPGAENFDASEQARIAGLDVIDDGSCILVELRRSPNERERPS